MLLQFPPKGEALPLPFLGGVRLQLRLPHQTEPARRARARHPEGGAEEEGLPLHGRALEAAGRAHEGLQGGGMATQSTIT